MHFAVACGGTGGHIFPGLATARELARRGHRVTLWLAGKDVESEAVKDWEGEKITVPAQGFPSGLSPKALLVFFKLLRAVRRVKRDMRRTRPDAVLAMGSYASAGPVGAAISLKIPFVLHESNVIPGRAVRLFSRRAAAVAGCFDETRYHLRHRNLVLTGMPMRADLLAARDAGASGEARHEGVRFLVMGGSRGARALNDLVSRALIQLHQQGQSCSVIHLTGEADHAAVAAAYAGAGVDARVLAFTRAMGPVYAASDFVISRAGAATCAELSAFGLPALLVPYPHAIHDHQTHNARAMEKTGAADMVPEKDITIDWLSSYIQQIIRHPEMRQRMAAASRARSAGDGAVALADLVENMARNHRDAVRS